MRAAITRSGISKCFQDDGAVVNSHFILLHLAEGISTHHRTDPRNIAVAARTGIDPVSVAHDAGASIVRAVSDLSRRVDESQRTLLRAMSKMTVRLDATDAAIKDLSRRVSVVPSGQAHPNLLSADESSFPRAVQVGTASLAQAAIDSDAISGSGEPSAAVDTVASTGIDAPAPSIFPSFNAGAFGSLVPDSRKGSAVTSLSGLKAWSVFRDSVLGTLPHFNSGDKTRVSRVVSFFQAMATVCECQCLSVVLAQLT